MSRQKDDSNWFRRSKVKYRARARFVIRPLPSSQQRAHLDSCYCRGQCTSCLRCVQRLLISLIDSWTCQPDTVFA
jgi:hypothetical protein